MGGPRGRLLAPEKREALGIGLVRLWSANILRAPSKCRNNVTPVALPRTWTWRRNRALPRLRKRRQQPVRVVVPGALIRC